MTNAHHNKPPVIDYEGSTYRTDFWEGTGRDYEDLAERVAVSRLLPFNGGRRLLELGAGYGRMTPMYHAYEQVVVMDYSLTQIQQAQAILGRQPRYVYVVADVYNLPFKPGVFDAATLIRVMHHLRDVFAALAQVRAVLAPGSTFVLEHANKRNLKAMLRYAARQQDWNPYTREPHEFVELNIDFHPAYMVEAVREAGFEVVRRSPVSYLRLAALKRNVPTGLLVWLDGALQQMPYYYSPSVFLQNVALGATPNHVADVPLAAPDGLFASPLTQNPLRREGDVLIDDSDGTRWAVRDGIYDFKTPL